MSRKAGKWNYRKREYDPCLLPNGASMYETDMLKIVQCASCGEWILYREGYTSMEIHNRAGFGYTVCPKCYGMEWERRRRYKDEQR